MLRPNAFVQVPRDRKVAFGFHFFLYREHCCSPVPQCFQCLEPTPRQKGLH